MAETDPADETRATPSRASHDPLTSTSSGADDPFAQPADPLPTRIGQFEIRMLLGEGAFGRVYLGFDPELERPVAIKQPHRLRLTPEFRDRFLREARATATIHHPNVCPVYVVGTDGDLPYIVMHYVAGGTLAGLLDPDGPTLSLRQKLTIAWKLAKGLAAAHAQKVIHRDLKPANVLYDKARREVLITDFGLARIGGQARGTLEGAVFGTPAYMSPEQAKGQTGVIGPLSDIYSLGIILYEMLTGRVPFSGGVYEVLRDHWETPPHPPSVVRPGLDPRLDTLCLKALAKNPTDRYASAKEFADALADYLRGGEPGGASADPDPKQVVFDLPDEPAAPAAVRVPPRPRPPAPRTPRPAEPEPSRSDPQWRMRRGAKIVAGLMVLFCVALGVVTALKPKPEPVEVKAPPAPPALNAFNQDAEQKATEALLKLRKELKANARVTSPTPELVIVVHDLDKKTDVVVKDATDVPDSFHVKAIELSKVDWDIDGRLVKCFTGLFGPLKIQMSTVSHLSDETLVVFARIPKLEELSLDDTPRVTDAGLAIFTRHAGIKKVKLANLNVTAAVGKTLGSLPALADLDLDKALVTDELLAAVKSASTLTSLNCTAVNSYRASRLTRAGMESVAAMKNLSKLTLSYHPVEDSWLPALYSLKPKSINLTSTNTTEDGRKELRKKVGAGCTVLPEPP